VGATGLVTGGLLGTLALLERQSVDELDRPGSETQRADARRRGIALATGADVAFAVGIASLSTAITLFFASADRVGNRSTATSTRQRIGER
jgi:hypothetical protein